MSNTVASPSFSAFGLLLATASDPLRVQGLGEDESRGDKSAPANPPFYVGTNVRNYRMHIDSVRFADMYMDSNHESTWGARSRPYPKAAVEA